MRMPATHFLSLFENQPPGVKFVLGAQARGCGDKLVTVNVAKLDAAWAKEADCYIGKGGTGNVIGQRYPAFKDFKLKGIPIQVSEVVVDDLGAVRFINGRHRFSVLRDEGMQQMPVAMSDTSIANAQRFGYLA